MTDISLFAVDRRSYITCDYEFYKHSNLPTGYKHTVAIKLIIYDSNFATVG